MRGGALCPAARLLCALAVSVVPPLGAQAPTRTRDVGFATVAYDNGLTLGAITLTEGIAVERTGSALFATGLVSLFNDGRWSMQGALSGSRYSAPIPLHGELRRWFETLRGELSLNTMSTAQQGFMPTLQVLGQTRLHLIGETRAIRGGAAVTRTFDGFAWRTTVLGEVGGWTRLGDAVVGLTSTPMQLQYGDLLGDTEGTVTWSRGRFTYDVSLGVRLGEAQRGPATWGTLTATWPVFGNTLATASLGNYPIDLIQGLPGGRYAAIALRLPGGRFPSFRRRPPVPVAPVPLETPELPVTERLALVMGPSLDSLFLREVRVWAPGVARVELMGDFTDWVAVPLIRQPNGEWRGYYRVAPGAHRVNLRLDREQFDVPVNLARVSDEFVGEVGIIVVR